MSLQGQRYNVQQDFSSQRVDFLGSNLTSISNLHAVDLRNNSKAILNKNIFLICFIIHQRRPFVPSSSQSLLVSSRAPLLLFELSIFSLQETPCQEEDHMTWVQTSAHCSCRRYFDPVEPCASLAQTTHC